MTDAVMNLDSVHKVGQKAKPSTPVRPAGCRFCFQPDPWGFKKETHIHFPKWYGSFARSHVSHNMDINAITLANPAP